MLSTGYILRLIGYNREIFGLENFVSDVVLYEASNSRQEFVLYSRSQVHFLSEQLRYIRVELGDDVKDLSDITTFRRKGTLVVPAKGNTLASAKGGHRYDRLQVVPVLLNLRVPEISKELLDAALLHTLP